MNTRIPPPKAPNRTGSITNRIVRTDLRKSVGINIMLMLLMALSVLLAATGASIVTTLATAVDDLFVAAKTPSVVQMHSGTLDMKKDPARINEWALKRDDVTATHVVEMLPVDNSQLLFNNTANTEDSQDNSLVTQNSSMDILLDLDNKPLSVAPGDIAVPIYHRERLDLQLGDTVTVKAGDVTHDFTVSNFLRDSMMNPGLASSKRFLINEKDAQTLRSQLGAPEYLIEFALTDSANKRSFQQDYAESGLPADGMALSSDDFKMLTVLSDGILAAIVIVVSLLLLTIAALCLRFAFLTTAEQDRHEIGVMKAIGIPSRTIKSIYLRKYALLAGAATVLGFLGTLVLTPYLTENVAMYNGTTHTGLAGFIIPAIPALLMLGAFMLFTQLLLRKINRIPALDALTSPAAATAHRSRLSLHTSRRTPLHIRLGLMDVLGRARTYALTASVFIASAFIMIVPINMATTISDESFISYLGIARSDVYIDLRSSADGMEERFDSAREELAAHPDVEKEVGFVTSGYEFFNVAENEWISQSIQNGDHNVFPVTYTDGVGPKKDTDIALSWATANDLSVKVGDTVKYRDIGTDTSHTLTVSGIYQDVTNGGRTAKANLGKDSGTPMVYTIAVGLRDGANADALIREWSDSFAPGRVAKSTELVERSLSGTISQVKTAATVSTIVAAALAALMTALFTQMLLARDKLPIAIQQMIGASKHDIRVQYVTRMWLILAGGVIAGTVLANLLGPLLIGSVSRFLGASSIDFVVNPWLTYLACPLFLFVAVGLSAAMATSAVKTASATDLAGE
ncbi:ABC transporter permease [Corynebacterium sp. H113]|uniref:ABC transporter permease n=1 Tax=Corynebacterium sp. H113 TaxID=3133419 RepID=UPI0030A65B48